MEPVADSADSRPLGRVLSEERERQGLSRTDIAQRLHMSQFQVEALEGGDYERLPKGPFLRGFVRNYARALHIDGEKLLPLLASAAPKSPAPGIVVPTQNIRFDPINDRLSNPYLKAAGLATVAICLAFAAMYWWLFIRPTPPATDPARKAAVQAPAPAAATPPATQQVVQAPMPPAEAPPPTEAPKEEVPAAGAPSPRPSPKGEAEKPAATAPSARPTSAGETENPPAAAPVAGERRVKFRFRDQSWVEVRDARGKTLISKLNLAGTETEVSGKPPLVVIVGNAPAVEVATDERRYDLEPFSRVGVARLTIP